MNPADWEDPAGRWQTNMSAHQKPDHGRCGSSSGTHGSHPYSQYTGDPGEGPQNGPAGRRPPPHDAQTDKAEVFGPGWKPFDPGRDDRDWMGKLGELRDVEEAEERVHGRKAAVARETASEPSPAASDGGTGPTLRDRVNAILQRRRSDSVLSKSHFCKNRFKSSGPRKGEDHPLKIRVNMLMNQRMSRPCVSPPHTQPPPQLLVPSPAEEDGIDQGFQRFLSILNKGVDVDLLRRIASDDSEDPCLDDKLQDIQHHEATVSPFRRESQYSDDGTSLPEHGGESSTQPRSQERARSNPIPDNGENKEELLSPFSSKTLSKSPSGISNKKEVEEEEEELKHDEQHKQLQNILKSLGLQLEVEEMSRLANRTQERLYGKKTDGGNAESRGRPDRQPRSSPGSSRSSSSSLCSCSSSSRSSSRSRSPSSSSRGNSQSRQTANGNGQREGSSGKLTLRDHSQAGEKRLKVSQEEKIQYRDQHYAQNQTLPPIPNYSFTPLPDYTVSQYSQYSVYSTHPYHDATSNWTYSQESICTSFHPSSQTPKQCHHFPIPVLERERNFLKKMQPGPSQDQRRSQVVCAFQVDGKPQDKEKRTRKRVRNKKRRTLRKKRRKEAGLRRPALKAVAEGEESGEGPQPDLEDEARGEQMEQPHRRVTVDHDSTARSTGKSNRRLSEEEIKANLRRTLEAFNKKVKQAVTRPLGSLTTQVDEDLS